ncbi:MAG: septum formation protein Maf [Verrucomicrobia bacterium]|nr:septum formation protein Maf [Verrucomicrobiota bacterium]
MKLILASASPRRAELLKSLGLQFDVMPTGVAERDEHPTSFHDLAIHNAQAKARDAAARHSDALVLGADTIVVLGTEVFGKPRDLDDARRMLRSLSCQRHSVITGVCLVHRAKNSECTFAVETRVRFRPLSDADIEQYLGAVDVSDKAGAYAIQEGPPIVAGIEGSYSNVIGLPLERLAAELREFGVPA